MSVKTTLEDLIGIEHCKLGFYQELQQKVEELKLTNDQLEKKSRENQALLEGISDLMVVLSADLKIQSVNHVFQEWFPGIDPVGQYCYTIFHDKKTGCDNCLVLRALDLDITTRDSCIYKLKGKNRHFESTASPLKKSCSGEKNVLLFQKDVTQQKELQAQFYQAEKMATLGTLAAGVAHEINNPLTAINGFTEGLQRRLPRIHNSVDEELYEDFKEYIRTILSECVRCRNIVSTLLSFSRPEMSKFNPVDLNQCINDTLFILKHHFRQRKKSMIKISLHPELPWILGDESQLKQVIINLLINALDATGENDTILIRTNIDQSGAIMLVVEDTGCGIREELLDKLFEPFFTTKPVGKGVGIGLSTCYSIVKNHNGTITTTSIPGEGSSFYVLLPAITEE